MPELAEVVDGQPEEVDEGVGEEVHSEESGDDNDSIPDLEETEAVADGEVAANGAGNTQNGGWMFINFDISRWGDQQRGQAKSWRKEGKFEISWFRRQYLVFNW